MISMNITTQSEKVRWRVKESGGGDERASSMRKSVCSRGEFPSCQRMVDGRLCENYVFMRLLMPCPRPLVAAVPSET